MQEEMKKLEREQMLEKLEKMNLEDFRVLRGNRNTTQNRRNELSLTGRLFFRPWRRRKRSSSV